MIQSLHDLTNTFGELAEVSTSEPHRLLAVERRRIALEILSEGEVPVTLDELAAAIATREAERDVVEPDAIERVAISLHHAHLPMMEEFGVINYDLATARIESDTRPDSHLTP